MLQPPFNDVYKSNTFFSLSLLEKSQPKTAPNLTDAAQLPATFNSDLLFSHDSGVMNN